MTYRILSVATVVITNDILILSAGTAVITNDKAALWTDGRYYLQAEKQLDENWVLMRDGKVW
jgi:hypothetical protein